MAKAVDGEDVRVNAHTIEKRLADIWREEQEKEERAVTRAALWNVVAHTWTTEQHAHAANILGRASASVPQRTIVVRANPGGADELSSWISANCHLVSDGRQVCSEEVAISAAGERVHHVPPLVASLLLPDMPVAVWWLGDLPGDHRLYAETLLDPADRLIVDSSQFDSASDLDLVWRISGQTTTAPADLNWTRMEEWRVATAALFDPPSMRKRMRALGKVRVFSGGGASLGDLSEALLYVSWLTAQLGADVAFDFVPRGNERGIGAVELRFGDDTAAVIRSDRERGVVVSSEGTETALDCVIPLLGRDDEDLVVRMLKRPEADKVYLRTLNIARELAERIA